MAAASSDQDVWKVTLVPLDRVVLQSPSFDGIAGTTWELLTSYVPPRHRIRGVKPRPCESLEAQIHRELTMRLDPGAGHAEEE